jgi:hypothetical protein
VLPRNSLNWVNTDVNCRRGRLFDELAAFIIYEMCMEEPTATVSNAGNKQGLGNN